MRPMGIRGRRLAGAVLLCGALAGARAPAQVPGLQGCALLIPDAHRIQNSQLRAPQLSLDGRFVAYETLEGNRRELHVSDTGSWARHRVRAKPPGLWASAKGFESELHWCPAPGRQSRFVFVTGEENNFDIYLADAAEPNAPAIPLVTWSSNDYKPIFSPDGRDLAFVSTKDRKEGSDLYVILDVDRKLREPSLELLPVRLTTSEGGVLYPAWSPDGRWISLMLETTEDGVLNDGISVLEYASLRPSLQPGEDATARAALQRVTSPQVSSLFLRHDEVGASWSPDGAFLAFYLSAHAGDRKERKATGGVLRQSLGVVRVQRTGDALSFVALEKLPLAELALDPTVDSFLRGPVWSLDSRFLLVVKDSQKEDNPIRIVAVPGGELREEAGTKLNRDLFAAPGNDGATAVLFSASDRETTSLYRCELR